MTGGMIADPKTTPMMRATCCVLEVVIRDRRDTEDDRRREQGVGHQFDGLVATNGTVGELDEQSGHQDDEDADTGDRAVRRTNEASHVATDGRNGQADEQDEDQTDDDDAGHGLRDHHVAGKTPQHETDRDHGEQYDGQDDRHRQVTLGQRNLAALVTGLGGANGVADALGDGADDLDESPDGRHTNRAGADEAHVTGEDLLDDVEVAANLAGDSPWQYRSVGDDDADEHGCGDGDTDEMTNADEGHRHADANHRATAVAYLEQLGEG